MVNDWASDLVTRVRNGYLTGRKEMAVRRTRLTEQLAKVLAENGYVEKEEVREGKLVLTLKYAQGKGAVTGIRRVSKPGMRRYTKARNIPRVWGGWRMNILSTSKGIMSDKRARELKVGGEVICQVW